MEISESFELIWQLEAVLAVVGEESQGAGAADCHALLADCAPAMLQLREAVRTLFEHGMSRHASASLENIYRYAGAAIQILGEEEAPETLILQALTELLGAISLQRRFATLTSTEEPAAPDESVDPQRRGRRREQFADYIAAPYRTRAARIVENTGRVLAGRRGMSAADVFILLFRMGYLSPALSFAAVNNTFRQADGKTPLICQRDFRRYVTARMQGRGLLFNPKSAEELRSRLMV